MSKVTFTQFFSAQHLSGTEANSSLASDISLMLGDIARACIRISKEVNKGALVGTMGSLESENVQGEVQKALDVITNDIFIECNQQSGLIAGMASEELDDPYVVPEQNRKQAKYLLSFDPLDGSSNVNVNISVGTIFSILPCPEGVIAPHLEDFFQAGTAQICAGYALYGTSTMLVITTGNGVNGFTLDNESNEFILTHPNLQIPIETKEFAINMSNYRFWEAPIQNYIDECLQGVEGRRDKDFNMRWVASMVAEVHRILIRGGIFMYPMDSKIKAKGGKLRLLYEANPMSFIVEQAGGGASTGRVRILDIKPKALHQRVPVILGSKSEVDLAEAYHKRK
ncbi:MAG: class 1 fructose-bisphosphatase [Methylophilaceae bacterium]